MVHYCHFKLKEYLYVSVKIIQRLFPIIFV